MPGVNLIRPVSFRNSTNSVAAWTLESAAMPTLSSLAPPATINIVQPNLPRRLTVAANTPLCSTTTTADVRLVNNNAAYGRTNFCLTITNNGDITLTEHIVNIPVLGINNQVFTATLTPINSAVAVSRSLVITYGSPLGLAWTAALSRTIIEATLTAQTVVTSTTENKTRHRPLPLRRSMGRRHPAPSSGSLPTSPISAPTTLPRPAARGNCLLLRRDPQYERRIS